MATKDFVTAWKSNMQLHEDFKKDPEKILNQYGITGADREQLLSAAKTGGQAVESRINAFSTKTLNKGTEGTSSKTQGTSINKTQGFQKDTHGKTDKGGKGGM